MSESANFGLRAAIMTALTVSCVPEGSVRHDGSGGAATSAASTTSTSTSATSQGGGSSTSTSMTSQGSSTSTSTTSQGGSTSTSTSAGGAGGAQDVTSSGASAPATGGSGGAGGSAPDPIAQGLLGYWRFNGDGSDESGSNLDLTLAGGVGFAPGLEGQALALNGNAAQYASRPVDDELLDFATANFTVQAWVMYNDDSGAAAQQTFCREVPRQVRAWLDLSPVPRFAAFLVSTERRALLGVDDVSAVAVEPLCHPPRRHPVRHAA